ncbi:MULTISPECIES: hypothetical protein [Streptomycetaceae]|uniref:Uncharacterized protein n=1 Tax=Streptantibioticus cattleyicolor (strain ATCC 35852 / DSM 46488 / JCM 4925 / NBRC 14057 / NRRL 8057) TaxID=1003195 RepID=F8JYB4_STREN|nr:MULTISPECIES: hypothetical protein [Streptomycetaceae]AEW95908.1 hypothetical protein SCATT_35370 [Streptantibioticus cattleyicolor NRRL 8057 = DSM 46488]MYS60445.1 hypothetical protein [Streptomyces sp. SID5468]CCB76244.1 protein of unknown function [Streptantibioticus cattleyicolor NRRL 8057 = DSM 46488]
MDDGTGLPVPLDGPPRYVAVFRRAGGDWVVAAQSPGRGPVEYAVAAMTRTVRARGQAPWAEVWGPDDEGRGWRRLRTVRGRPGPAAASGEPGQPRPSASARDERLRDRRHQVLLTALAAAGLTDLEPADTSAVTHLTEVADEDDLRRIAHWLASATASGQRAAGEQA